MFPPRPQGPTAEAAGGRLALTVQVVPPHLPGPQIPGPLETIAIGISIQQQFNNSPLAAQWR